MSFARNREFRVEKLSIGSEHEPLLVIDNFLADPEQLRQLAMHKVFGEVASYYPGLRAKVPLTIQSFILETLRDEFAQAFELRGKLRFTACHFSLITTLPEKLSYLQRMPHVDSLLRHELALILYLFKTDCGGTAFYRHKATGFEFIDEFRKDVYWRHVQEMQQTVECTTSAYMCGDTEFYERVARQRGLFNRMLVYRRTSLHSADLGPDFVPCNDPRLGRLSVNGFIA